MISCGVRSTVGGVAEILCGEAWIDTGRSERDADRCRDTEDSVRLVRNISFGLVFMYSITLIIAEFRFSQDYVRSYFTDIYGPVFFYAINTTISTTLLSSTALIFVISAMCVEEIGRWRRKKLFYFSQALLFVYLCVDERFMIHEYVGMWFGFDDALVLVVIAIVEAAVLLVLGDLKSRSRTSLFYLCVGAVFFGIMLLIDGLIPKRAALRLSFEDLSKVWAEVFLFLFAFGICRDAIAGLKKRSRPAETAPL